MMLFCVQREGAAHLRDRLTLRLLKPAYGCDCRLANGIYRDNSPRAYCKPDIFCPQVSEHRHLACAACGLLACVGTWFPDCAVCLFPCCPCTGTAERWVTTEVTRRRRSISLRT